MSYETFDLLKKKITGEVKMRNSLILPWHTHTHTNTHTEISNIDLTLYIQRKSDFCLLRSKQAAQMGLIRAVYFIVLSYFSFSYIFSFKRLLWKDLRKLCESALTEKF